MRTWGRVPNGLGGMKWIVVETDVNGFNDYVYITALIQCLKLSVGESPFYANYGIPAQQSVVTQIFPDFYVNQMQQLFSPYFASLIIAKVPPVAGNPDPIYNINIVTNQGARVSLEIAT